MRIKNASLALLFLTALGVGSVTPLMRASSVYAAPNSNQRQNKDDEGDNNKEQQKKDGEDNKDEKDNRDNQNKEDNKGSKDQKDQKEEKDQKNDQNNENKEDGKDQKNNESEKESDGKDNKDEKDNRDNQKKEDNKDSKEQKDDQKKEDGKDHENKDDNKDHQDKEKEHENKEDGKNNHEREDDHEGDSCREDSQPSYMQRSVMQEREGGDKERCHEDEHDNNCVEREVSNFMQKESSKENSEGDHDKNKCHEHEDEHEHHENVCEEGSEEVMVNMQRTMMKEDHEHGKKLCPVTVSVPVDPSVVCGPNNDIVTVPANGNHVTYTTTGWVNGEYTVTATVDPGYFISGTQGLTSQSWTYTDSNTSCGQVLGETTTTPTTPVVAQLENTGTSLTLPMFISSGILGFAALTFMQNKSRKQNKVLNFIKRETARLRDAFAQPFVVATA